MTTRYQLVVIGTSWGGLAALTKILEVLPQIFRLPIVIVQHRGKDSDDTLGTLLQRVSKLTVREAEDKAPLVPGTAYIAPPDYHCMIEDGLIALSTDDLVGFSRPSIDVLFESAADGYGSGVIGVLLTGANQDGTRGLQRIKAHGGYVVVQDPKTAESRTMPEAAIAGVQVNKVVPLEAIADLLVELSEEAPVGKKKLAMSSASG